MRLKTFIAATIAEAMARVRAELGPDAVIVATEKPARGPARVIAAIEPDPPLPGPALDAEPDSPPPPVVASAPSAGFEAVLVRHGAPPALRRRLAASASGTGEAALAAALAACFRFADLTRRRSAAPIVLLGPHGAGKTSTAAKLAARARLDGHAVRLVSCDTWRAAGSEQLGVYAAALSAPLDVVSDAPALAAALAVPRGDALAIVDTPGLDPFSAADRAVAAELVRAARGDAALVLPAGLDAEESADLARGFASLGCMRLVATRLDAARRLGGVLAAADAGALALAGAGISPRIADGLASLDARFLARRLLAPWERTAAPEPRALERVP